MLPNRERYWRGPVLDVFDGYNVVAITIKV